MSDTLVNDSEYAKMEQAIQAMKWVQGEPVPASYLTILRAFRWTGCHTSALSAKPPKQVPQIKDEKGTHYLQWFRPKTFKLCLHPIPQSLVEPLGAYLAGKRYSVRQLQNIVRQAGEAAGLGPSVTPRALRKLRGAEVSASSGPGTAARMLGVSDRVLAKYAVLADKDAILRLSKDFSGVQNEQVDAAFAGSIIKSLHARVHELEREKEPKRTAARGCPCECPASSVTILEDRFGSVFGYHCSRCRHDHKLKRKVRRGN